MKIMVDSRTARLDDQIQKVCPRTGLKSSLLGFSESFFKAWYSVQSYCVLCPPHKLFCYSSTHDTSVSILHPKQTSMHSLHAVASICQRVLTRLLLLLLLNVFKYGLYCERNFVWPIWQQSLHCCSLTQVIETELL
jgi:hypothetical protein